MKDDREIYELLNNIEIDENEFIEAEVSETEKKRVENKVKKFIKKKNYRRYALIAGIALSIGISAITIEPTLAYGIPIIGDMLLDKEIKNKPYKEYAEIIGETKEKNGVKATLNSAILDENTLIISYSFYDEKARLTEDNLDIMNLGRDGVYLDGEMIFTGSSETKYIDNRNLNKIYYFDIADRKIGNEVEVNIMNKELLGAKGDFGFKFKIRKDKIGLNSIVLDDLLEENKKLENLNKDIDFIELRKISKTPLGMKILGTNANVEDIRVLDSKGNELKGGWHVYDGSTKLNLYEYEVSEDMDEITLVPIQKNDRKEGLSDTLKLEKDMKGKEILIDENTKAIIDKVEIDGDYVIITYDTEVSGNLNLKEPSILYLKKDDEIINVAGLMVTEDEWKKICEKLKSYEVKGKKQSIFKVKYTEDLEVGIRYDDNKEALMDKAVKVSLNKN